MFEMIKKFWASNSLENNIYMIAGMILCSVIIYIVFKKLTDSPTKKLDFIKDANDNNRLTIGKMSCLTINGEKEPSTYHAEYMYMVDNKTYFVTYEINYAPPIDTRRDGIDPDMMLRQLPITMILFYDKKNPKKVYSKLEVFTSSIGIHKVPTPKKNMWRNVDSDWQNPIDLVTY